LVVMLAVESLKIGASFDWSVSPMIADSCWSLSNVDNWNWVDLR
jgi:hypothetical protein